MSLIHLDIFDKDKLATFQKLDIFAKEAILAGGTALALQLAHRQSVDFDLFLFRKITRNDFSLLKKTFGIKKVEFSIEDQLTVTTSNEEKITLVNYYHQPLFATVKTISLPLFAVKDIACDKAYTVGRRATWRDYVDLFFILKKEILSIFELISFSQQKFKEEFNPRLFLEQLSYFEDLEISPTTFIGKSYTSEEIQNFLSTEVDKFRAVVF